MSQFKIKEKIYDDGRTKQAFKDSTDINKILKKAQKAGTLSHLQRHGAFYGDFADFDFDDAQFALARARSIFDELPSEVRAEFGQNPGNFFAFVNDPANSDRLGELLPAIAEPGRHPAVVSAAAKAEQAKVPEVTPAEASEPPQMPPETPQA